MEYNFFDDKIAEMNKFWYKVGVPHIEIPEGPAVILDDFRNKDEIIIDIIR